MLVSSKVLMMTMMKMGMKKKIHDDSLTCGSLGLIDWEIQSDVDYFPSVKERMKSMAEFSVKSFKFLHTMDWAGFEQYARHFVSRTKHTRDATALVAISLADKFTNVGNWASVEKLFSDTEQQIPQTSMPQSIRIRFICSKADVLKQCGKNQEGKYLLAQAAQLAENEPPSNPTAYCFAQYALIGLVHDCIRPNGDFSAPSESVWNEAEHYTLGACEQHQEWVKDLDDDYKVSEDVQQRFFLWMFIRYVGLLLRSCSGAGFTYFEDVRVPKENLEKARSCIDRLKSKEIFLTPRSKLRLRLIECDYFLRQAQICYNSASVNELTTIYLEGQSCAEHAKRFSFKYDEPRIASFDRSISEMRLQYIQSKLNVLNTGQKPQRTKVDCRHIIRHTVDIKDQEKTSYTDPGAACTEGEFTGLCLRTTCEQTLVKPTTAARTAEEWKQQHLSEQRFMDLRMDNEDQTLPKYNADN